MTTQPPLERTLMQVILDFKELSADHAGSVVPDDLEDHLPFYCVTILGGPRSKQQDFPIVDLDVYAATNGSARAACNEVDELFSGRDRIRAVTVDGTRRVIDDCFCNKQPSRLPWDGNEGRYGATYAFTLRRA